jgi:Protein of unknown function (DUF2950)
MVKQNARENQSGLGLNGWATILALLVLTLLFATAKLLFGATQSKPQPTAPASPAQEGFATPQKAADALIAAAENYDVPMLLKILGPDGKDLVTSSDSVQDKNSAKSFAALAKEKRAVNVNPKVPNTAILSVGNDDWPLPIPIVRRAGKWYFDSKTGAQEVLYRRIGRNELDAIQVCRGYVNAQHEYAMTKHDGSTVNQYAQRVISTPGKHDGLAWKNPDGTFGGPVGENIADVLQEGYSDKSQPYHGYYFKILKGQGPAAPLGQMSFIVNGAMIGGFALAAAPAHYRVTGVKTFIVGYDGIVYQKDLGPDTLQIFKAMQLYNPDKTWQKTDDSW